MSTTKLTRTGFTLALWALVFILIALLMVKHMHDPWRLLPWPLT
jgi:hypothetical protein